MFSENAETNTRETTLSPGECGWNCIRKTNNPRGELWTGPQAQSHRILSSSACEERGLHLLNPVSTLIGNSAGSKVRRVHICNGPLHLETLTFILPEGCGANVW